jgi:hypothetical protein
MSRKRQISPFKFNFPIRPMLRPKRVKDILESITSDPPSRSSLLKLIKSGEIQGKRTTFGWLVFEDSFQAWVKKQFG